MFTDELLAVGSRLSASGCWLTAIGFWLLADGYRLPACLRQSPPRHCVALSPLTSSGAQESSAGFRLPAFGVPSAIPPSPLRGPLPPDKQWGAREFIGARHPPLDRGGQGRSADFRLPASGFRLSAFGSRLPASGFRLSASGYRLLRGGADALISEILNFLR